VVKFIELIQTQNNVYLIYEYCNGGTLEQLIQSQGRLKEQEAVELMRQIIKGMQSVVELNIVHRDLKPQNILFHNQVVKIIDFGFCKPLYNQNLAKTMLGSPIYMAPEVLKGQEYCRKADIWSLGIILFEMLNGFCPYNA
jgi:serine/threonine protein kinase